MAHPLDVSDPVESLATTGAGDEFRLQYLRAYSFLFERSGGWRDVTWLSLWLLAPVIGQLIVIGYAYNAVAVLCRDRAIPAPRFSSAHTDGYLHRGASPWGFSAMYATVVFPITFVAIYVIMMVVGLTFLFAFSGGSGSTTTLWIVSIVALLLILALLSLCFFLLAMLSPMSLRSALAQQFGNGFYLRWVWDFFRRVWFELFLSLIFWIVSGALVVIVGSVLTLGIGAPVSIALVHLAGVHLNYQLYLLYLQRGGSPIPMAPVMLPPNSPLTLD